MLIKNAQLLGADKPDSPVDLACRNGIIHAIGQQLTAEPGEAVIDARGNAVLPGLHDHHLHLFALAAAENSVPCGAPCVENREALRAALRGAPGDGWVRGINYHESIAGALDRNQLDKWLADRPLRIQHSSGKMWFINSLGIEMLALHGATESGIERDLKGYPTGRLCRLDNWLQRQLANQRPPDLTEISRRLARYGITGVTDTTPSNTNDSFAAFAVAQAKGELLQRLRLMGSEDLNCGNQPNLCVGELKILLDEVALPDFDCLVQRISGAHRKDRGVAIHCVTEVELVFALAALREAGTGADRIEHASIIPDGALKFLQETGVTVVTQPEFIDSRGDRYFKELTTSELQQLYRLNSLDDAGIALAASSDAPYGNPDPWLGMRAAQLRRGVNSL